MKQFAIVGLGRFGISLAKALSDLGHDVFVIDLNAEHVKNIAPYVTSAAQADGTDLNALKALGISNVDALFVALARDISASLLTALNALELGIPAIYAKAYSEKHAKILQKLGVTKVYMPEIEMGQRIARELSHSNLLELIELDPENEIVEMIAPVQWQNKTIAQLNVRNKYDITILLIKDAENLIVSPSPQQVISPNSKLLVLGNAKQIQKLQNRQF